jgi:hypothetical protein
VLVRLRHSKGVERQQVKWFAYALAVLATSSILSFVVSDTIGIRWLGQVSFVLVMASVVGLPVAVGIAILKYRLYNIDVLINDPVDLLGRAFHDPHKHRVCVSLVEGHLSPVGTAHRP